jgi:large subunit ribosomal protein L3
MKFILGKKLKMTQIWKDGKIIPVTVIEAGPVKVTQIRSKEKDGYEAVQVGFGTRKLKNIKKPQQGHFKELGNFAHVKEFRSTTNNQQPITYNIGDVLDVSQFMDGDKVKISGLSKGRGFQGVVKRYGFKGGPKTHGQKNRLRAPGSIGSTAPQRVVPGRRMAGRMGQERFAVKNLKVVEIDKANNILIVKGAIPGFKGRLVEIQG